jgi:predicted  nucleic acid-binding Zn-ribbon protein
MSHSTGSSSTTDRESINRMITTSVNEIKNIINQDLDYVLLHQELINGFCRHVSILQQQTFRLSTNHLCSLVLLKMLASLFKNDHPAIKSYTDLLAETWDNFDFNNGVLKYVQNELAEKRGKVKKYIEEQHAIDQQIASSEEQNSLLKEKKTKLAEAIRFENEDIVELEKECQEATHRKVGYNNELKRLGDLEGLMESKMHNIRETWSNVKSSIHL